MPIIKPNKTPSSINDDTKDSLTPQIPNTTQVPDNTTKQKPLTIFNPKTGLVDKWEGTLEEYREKQNIKLVEEYFNPEAKTITDFTNNAEVQARAADMMSYLDKKEYADGTKAADAFIDYARQSDYNLTKSLARSVKLANRDKEDEESQKFINDYNWLLEEFHYINPNGKYKYENVGASENLTLTGDIFKGISTDLFNWAALGLTGATALPEKIVVQQTANQALRQMIKQMAAKSYNVTLGKAAPIYNKIPKIPINTKSYKSTIGVLGTEGGVYAGLDTHLWQKRWNELGIEGYEEYDPKLTGTAIGVGFTLGGLLAAGTTRYVKYSHNKAASKEAVEKARESEEFKDTILGTPKGDPDVEIISVEEAAQLNRKIRENNNNPNSTHIEDVADLER